MQTNVLYDGDNLDIVGPTRPMPPSTLPSACETTRTMRSRCLRGMWAVGLGVAFLTAGCWNSALGACNAEAAAAFDEIDHYGGINLEPEDYPLGGRCVASFTSADEPEVVLNYYRAQWTAAGWTLDPLVPLASAPPEGDGAADFVFGGASAHKDGMTYSVTAFKEQETRYELLVGADQ